MPAPRKFAQLDEGSKIKATGQALSRPGAALKAAGAVMVAQATKAFRDQRKGSFRWPPRAVPNVAGLLSDLSRGAAPKARRFSPRPALVDTGTLRRSLNFRVIGGKSVEVGTTVPYAGIHQEGGTTTIQVTQKAKTGLAKLLRKRPQLDLGSLLSVDQVTIRVQRRPFLLVTPEDLREINAAMQAALAVT